MRSTTELAEGGVGALILTQNSHAADLEHATERKPYGGFGLQPKLP
jgi:hypothetical protein